MVANLPRTRHLSKSIPRPDVTILKEMAKIPVAPSQNKCCLFGSETRRKRTCLSKKNTATKMSKAKWNRECQENCPEFFLIQVDVTQEKPTLPNVEYSGGRRRICACFRAIETATLQSMSQTWPPLATYSTVKFDLFYTWSSA